MATNYEIDPYEPCPCGSGAKYKFCCASKAKRHGKFPIGTVAYYGPDDKTATKIAAGVILHEGADPIVERWMATNIIHDAAIGKEVMRFFAKHGVKNVAMSDGIMGCPHEEGIDFVRGTDCPFCPFWAGKQGSTRRDLPSNPEEVDDNEEDEVQDEDEDSDNDEDRDFEAKIARIEAVLGDGDETDREDAVGVLCKHLQANLRLPCEVRGIEDFRWEEPYVIGGWSAIEYRKLKTTQPSYTDRFLLLSISHDDQSEWMMFDDDIAAHVRRISDGKEFILGLAELEVTDKQLPSFQLVDDYAVWFVNSR